MSRVIIIKPLLLGCLCFAVAGPAEAVDAAQPTAAAARANQRLPRMVAESLRQERVVADGTKLVYSYTHLALDSVQLRKMRLEVTQRPYILPQLCSAPDTGRMLREGVRFRYLYGGRDGKVGGDLTLTKSDC